MKKSDYIWKSFVNAVGVFIYTAGVAWLLFNGKNVFDSPPTFLIPLFMLLLFMVSASVTGLLVLGKPIHLYLSGLKKEAFALLLATLAWLILFIAAVVFVLLAQ